MKTKLTLYTLDGCKKCQALKDTLTIESIVFDEISCDQDRNGIRCDNMEIDLDCNFYPIAVITKKVEKDRGGYHVYTEENTAIHFCTKYDELMIKRKIKNDYFAMCVHNTTEMIDLIKKNK